jgi:hypothetical protein
VTENGPGYEDPPRASVTTAILVVTMAILVVTLVGARNHGARRLPGHGFDELGLGLALAFGGER